MKKVAIILLFVTAILLVACNSSAASPGNPLASVTPVLSTGTEAADEVASVTFTPTAVLLSPTPTQPPPTATRTPSETPSPTAQPTVTSTSTASPTITPTPTGGVNPGIGLMIYYVKVKTGGSVACGDSLFGVGTGIQRTGKVAVDARKLLERMFSNHQKTVGTLYNPLYKAHLGVLNVSFNPDDGRLIALLGGAYKSTGDPCDNLRVRAMVWTTLRQFSEAKIIELYVGNIPLGDYLSNGR